MDLLWKFGKTGIIEALGIYHEPVINHLEKANCKKKFDGRLPRELAQNHLSNCSNTGAKQGTTCDSTIVEKIIALQSVTRS